MISFFGKIVAGVLCCITAAMLLVAPVPLQAQQWDKQKIIAVPGGEIAIEDVFKLIKTSGDVTVFYSKDVLNGKDKINLKGGKMPLNTLLDQVAATKKLTYLYKNGVLIFQKKGSATPADQAAPGAARIAVVKGVVVNATGVEVPGITVHAQKGGQRAITNEEGLFTLRNVAADDLLEATGIGYERTEAVPEGNKKIVITLKNAARLLDEVVVTALGIKRDEKSLGYATQQFDGSAVTNAPTNGLINALSGKVAGLNLTKPGGPMGSSRVILRGESVLDMNSDGALIVVDGVPISTRFVGTGSNSYLDGDSPIDFGSSLTDLNADDIESINTLKGPSAAALYGSRASNGAIIITTKSGSKNKKGLGVTVSSNVAVDQINRWPDYQYEYGQGLNNATYYSYGASADGVSTSSTSSAWGPKFNGQSYFQYNSPTDPITGARLQRLPWVPYTNNRKDFFKDGLSVTNTAAISGGNDNGNMRLSITRFKNDWILPNTGYNRYTVAFSGSTKLDQHLTLSTKINYTNKKADNLPNVGYNNQSIAYFMILQAPNVSLDWYQPYWLPGQEGIAQQHPFSSLIDNPYLIVNEMINASNRHNLTGNVSMDYKISKRLSLMVRSALDMGYEFRSQRRPKNTQKFQDGMYRQQTSFNWENNNDFLLKYVAKIKSALSVTASVGGNMRNEQRYYTNQRADRLAAPGVYNLANSLISIKPEGDRAFKYVNSVYAFANLSWKNAIFLDITGRNDWTSTLPVQNRSYFYPSVSASASITELVKLPAVINTARVRASFASVGYDAPIGTYNLEKTFVAGTLDGTASNPDIIPNPNLKPQRTNAVELGTQWGFFKDRINIDVTVYSQTTVDQILTAPIDASSGFNKILLNVGQVNNKGLELVLKATPLIAGSFNWQATVNWAANRNRVAKLTDAIGSTMILAKGARGTLEAHEGRPLGDIYGLGYQRSPNGEILFVDGLAQRTDETLFLGNTAPSWRGGLNNTFNFKGFSLSTLFETRQGGVLYSLSHAALMEGGKLKSSLPGREGGIIGKGDMLKDGKYVPNDVLVTNVTSYYDGLYNRDIVEGNMFNASYVKLREVTLQYTFPQKWFRHHMKFVQGATLGVYGRDLFVWSNFPMYDPETATMDNNTIIPGFETGQFPSTRTMGMNIKLNF